MTLPFPMICFKTSPYINIFTDIAIASFIIDIANRCCYFHNINVKLCSYGLKELICTMTNMRRFNVLAVLTLRMRSQSTGRGTAEVSVHPHYL